jgi:hypothetical protein
MVTGKLFNDLVFRIVVVMYVMWCSFCCLIFIALSIFEVVLQFKVRKKWEKKKNNMRKRQIVNERMIMLVQELRLGKGKLIEQKSVIINSWCLFQESKYFSPRVLSLSRGWFKSNIFQNIDQRQEYVGQWSPSSSEDG